MDLAHWHQCQVYHNQTHNWHGYDSEHRWQQHMLDSQRRDQLVQLGWDHLDAIQYRFNSHGFRSDEFDQTPCLVALGCSHTSGVGIREHDTWCSQLARNLGLKLANLGVGGASFDTCVRLLNHWLPKLNARLVTILEPPRDRFELFVQEGKPQVFAPSYNNHPFDDIKKLWFVQTENSLVNVWKNQLVVRQICQQHQVPVVSLDFESGLQNHKHPGYKWHTARDMAHCGIKNHQLCCERFQSIIQEQNLL